MEAVQSPEMIFPQNYGVNIGCLLSEMVNSPYALSRLSLAAYGVSGNGYWPSSAILMSRRPCNI
jgi:hypothetical protein